MDVCGGMLTNVGEVRMMETQQSDWPQEHLLRAYLSRNEEEDIDTDVPKILGEVLADISVSEKAWSQAL